MKSVKIVFILSSFHIRCLKRIKEFIENGFDVEVYGFNRGDTQLELDIKATIIGNILPHTSHIKRTPIIVKGIKSVLKSIKQEEVVIYAFGLDIAMWVLLLNRKHPYIFEESDLYHTYVGNSLVRNALERLDKKVIKHSLLTVFTSEGFAKYHYGDNIPNNVTFITNRLAESVLNCKPVIKNEIDINHLSVGFVGAIRFKAVEHFVKYFINHYPQHCFHFFGIITDEVDVHELIKKPNCFYHGKYTTPSDLPEIYSNIDLVLSTYDTEFINVKCAEPNKFYESLYFDTPIIVSEGTFLGEKVRRYNSGYVINAMDDNSIREFIDSLTPEDLANKIASIRSVKKIDSVNINYDFFKKLSKLLDNNNVKK